MIPRFNTGKSQNKRGFSAYFKNTFGFPLRLKGHVIQALTHKSFENSDAIGHLERLEFLGDALIGWVVARKLFKAFPDLDEGELSRMRSAVVSRKFLNKRGKQLGIADWCSHGFEKKRIPDSLYGNTLEAIVGAVYLEKGYSKARKMVDIVLPNDDHLFESRGSMDPKSQLFIWAQQNGRNIVFSTQELPQNANDADRFKAVLMVDGSDRFEGTGNTKKEAQMKASALAIAQLISN